MCLNPTAVVLDDGPHDGQSQPVSRGFGGEIRLEDALEKLGRETGARVNKVESKVGSRFEGGGLVVAEFNAGALVWSIAQNAPWPGWR